MTSPYKYTVECVRGDNVMWIGDSNLKRIAEYLVEQNRDIYKGEFRIFDNETGECEYVE